MLGSLSAESNIAEAIISRLYALATGSLCGMVSEQNVGASAHCRWTTFLHQWRPGELQSLRFRVGIISIELVPAVDVGSRIEVRRGAMRTRECDGYAPVTFSERP